MQIDALIHNAGFSSLDWTDDTYRAIYGTNVDGPIQLTQQLARYMRDGGQQLFVIRPCFLKPSLHDCTSVRPPLHGPL